MTDKWTVADPAWCLHPVCDWVDAVVFVRLDDDESWMLDSAHSTTAGAQLSQMTWKRAGGGPMTRLVRTAWAVTGAVETP